VNKVIENRILEKGGINTRAEQNSRAAAGQAPAKAAEETAKVSRKVLRDYYDYIRTEEENAYKARLAEANDKVPELRALFSAETQINSEFITMKPGPDAREKRQRLKDRRLEIEEQKKALLAGRGYPEDYLERKYRCNICKDTGYTDEGRVCTCAKERAEEAYEWISRTGNR
jgi:DNA replication protein DnaC